MSKCRSPKQYIEFYDKEKRHGAAHINLEDNKRVLDRITHKYCLIKIIMCIYLIYDYDYLIH